MASNLENKKNIIFEYNLLIVKLLVKGIHNFFKYQCLQLNKKIF